MVVESFVTSIYSAIVSWTYILLVILIVVKIINFVTGGSILGNRGGEEREESRTGNERRLSDEDIGPRKRKSHAPSKVLVFHGVHAGDRIYLSWASNPPDEHVNYYWIERRRHARTPRGFKWNRNLWGNWRRVAYVSHSYSPEDPFVDHESFRNHEGIIREWWNSLDPIVPENDYEYRIRAVNSYGKGAWVKIRVSRPQNIDIWVPVIDDMGCDDEGNTHVEGHVELRRL